MRNADFFSKKKGRGVPEGNPMAPEEVRAPIAGEDPKKERQYSTLVFRPSLAPFDEGIVYGDFFPYAPYEDDGDEQWQKMLWIIS